MMETIASFWQKWNQIVCFKKHFLKQIFASKFYSYTYTIILEKVKDTVFFILKEFLIKLWWFPIPIMLQMS